MGTIICPHCQYNNEDTMRFCIMCGTSLAKICSNCQFANPPAAHYCGMCGQNLIGSDVPPFTLHPQVEKVIATAKTPAMQPAPPPDSGPPPPRRNGELPELSPRELVGERHVATVLLADVRNSTVLMEMVGTEAWVGVMNNIFQVLEAEIYRMGGEIDQYRGDGVLAFFGARSVHEDDPERAVLAGLSIQRSFEQYAKTLKKQFPDVDLKLRIGINTGEVIVTSIGNEQHYENTAMGGAIAVAARMESSAEPGTVLVSEDTYDLTKERFEYQPLGDLMVKGISEPIPVFRPISLKEGPMRPFSRASQWVGYEEQVEMLRESILDLSSGHGSIVMISGDKGMGKSYLIQHVRQELRREFLLRDIAEDEGDQPAPREGANQWLFSTSRSYGQSWPYSAWRELFGGWLRTLQRQYHTDDVEGPFNQFIEAKWPVERMGLVNYLRDFLTLPLEEQDYKLLAAQDANSYQQYFFEAVKEWVRVNAQEKPLILVFSNIHWGDDISFELLKYCLPLSDSLPIMWLLTMRPVRNSPGWNFRHYLGTEYPHRLEWIEMRPMMLEEANRLIDQMVGSDSLDEEERAFIFSRSEGNPYYLREIVYAMMDNESLVLDEEEGVWTLNPEKDLTELPDSLQGILQEYIAKLSAEERHVLQVASIMGTFFWFNLLQRMLQMDEETLNRYLTSLQRHQLVAEENIQEDMGMRFTFVSTLMREATYESMLLPQRKAFHRQCGELIEEWLEEREGQVNSLNQVYGYLAYHYEMAGILDKQMHFHIKTAQVAESLHANEEALWHLGRALEVSETLLSNGEMEDATEEERIEIYRQQFEILAKRRWILMLMADVNASIDDALRALALTEGPLDEEPGLRVDAILMYVSSSTNTLITQEEADKIYNYCEEALYLSRQIGDKHRELETLVQITLIRTHTSHDNVYEPSMQALDLARELGDVNMEFNILLNYGYHLVANDQTEEGMQFVNQALNLTDTVDDAISQINVLNVIGPQFERAGDYYSWLTEFVEVRLALSRKLGNRIAEADALLHAGMIRGNYLGDYESGLKNLEESKRLLGSTPSRLFALLRIAQCYVELNQHEKAQEALDEAQPLTQNITLDLAQVGYKLVQIMLNNEQDDEERLKVALKLAHEVEELGKSEGISQQYRMAAASHASSVHRKMAVLLGNRAELSEEDQERRQHHLEESLAKSQQALALYEDFGYTNAAEITGEWILYRMGQAMIANGQRTEALPFIKRAHDELMRKHDLIPEESPLRQTYLENIRHHRQIQASYRLL